MYAFKFALQITFHFLVNKMMFHFSKIGFPKYLVWCCLLISDIFRFFLYFIIFWWLCNNYAAI